MTEDHEHEHDEGDEAEPVAVPHEPTDEEAAEHEQAEAEPEHDEATEPAARETTPEEWEKRFKYAERRFASYRTGVEKEWAEDALHLVPFNLDPGAPPGYIDTRNAGHVEDETRTAALAFLGMHAEAEMRDDPYSVLCSTCAGWGLVKTGSIVPNQETRTCLDCNGVGYVPTGAPANAAPVAAASPAEGENGHVVPAAIGPESPEVQSLRMRGYIIIPPSQVEAG